MTPQAPEASPPLCPHCKKPLASVGWLINEEAGLVTFFHNEPDCMMAINCQFAQVKRQVQLANDLTRLRPS